MAEPKKSAGKASAPKGGDDGEQKRSALGWLAGWVLGPGLVLGAIVGAGAHLGANNPDAWYTEAVLWVVGLF